MTGHGDKASSVGQRGGEREGKLSGNAHGDQTRTQCDKVTRTWNCRAADMKDRPLSNDMRRNESQSQPFKFDYL
ncbi:hypothetical protein NQZ68_022763 [Dissostichus eleginoides]|nr:hypothetical protein NQZ68_022763 [Dissostichus eleginoides]